MIENLFTSKTRIKLLKLFLSNPDNRYYLRGLEKELQESLTPLRRELLRLTNMGILLIQEEANIKYYSLNKDFERLEELQKLVLGKDKSLINQATTKSTLSGAVQPQWIAGESLLKMKNTLLPRFGLLSAITVLLIGLVAFLIWTNSKNIQNLAKVMSEKSQTSLFEVKSRTSDERGLTSNSGGMKSSRWKIMPGNWPVLGGAEEKNEKSKEL